MKIIGNQNFKNKLPKCSFKCLFFFNLFIEFIILLFILFNHIKKISEIELNSDNLNEEKNIDKLKDLDKFEVNIYGTIKETILTKKCSFMWKNQREFLNGVVRKFKPRKIIEVGVNEGGSSVIILNAIQDIKNSHLYSIDIKKNYNVGHCVNNYFSQFKNKWTLYKGSISAKFMEKIGTGIDMAFIDTSHFEPGELLDFLMVLPFLKEEAIVIFHDIGNQINNAGLAKTRHEWAPYIIFNLVRGEKFYPSGDNILIQDIGAIKLEKNQKKYYYDYFRALGGQWEYFLDEKYINLMRDFVKKYYDEICLSMYNIAIEFNRNLVKNNPLINFYTSKAWKTIYQYKYKYN